MTAYMTLHVPGMYIHRTFSSNLNKCTKIPFHKMNNWRALHAYVYLWSWGQKLAYNVREMWQVYTQYKVQVV